MIYELSLVTKAELSEDDVAKVKSMVQAVIKEHDGEVYIEDDWGTLSFAQATSVGVEQGRFLYFLYKANNLNNVELARRFRINDGVLKHIVISVVEDENKVGEFVKKIKMPYSKKYVGSVTDTDDEDADSAKDRRRFSRRKSCWFTARKIKADWKDPQTYSWLVNEFGKISPARVSGISRKHHRIATRAIKQARNIGILSHLSDRKAYGRHSS